VNDAKMHHVVANARKLIADNPGLSAACLGLAFKANIDDFRESPARFVAASLAREFGDRINIVEPYAAHLPRAFEGTGASLIDIDTALETCGILIALVDHEIFRVIPAEERQGAFVYDTRGIWPDVAAAPKPQKLRVAG
jgi:UDP-N-acetyl-D-mannosaminuronic acid dehydrogenase